MKFDFLKLAVCFAIGCGIETSYAQNVGIGTTTPPDPLTVRSNGLGISQETPDGLVRMGFYITNAFGGFLQTHTNHDLLFATNNGSAQMVLQKATGNVGIGNINPTEAGLVVDKRVGLVHAIFGNNTSGLSLQSNSPAIGFNGYQSVNGYRTLTNGYAGHISFIPDNGEFRILSTATAIAPGNMANLVNRMIILPNGNVGIGTTNVENAGLVVNRKVGAVHAIFGNSTTGIAIESSFPGIGFNTYFSGSRKLIANGFGALMSLDPNTGNLSLFNSSLTGSEDANITLLQRFVINKDGNIGVQGNANPEAPLSFSNALGNKIALWGNPTTGHYGIGMQGSLLQFYSATEADDIAFGYGRSAAFSERLRIKGNGNVGIGTNSPTLAGLVVDQRQGRTNATFGSNRQGVSIFSNNPGIGFNIYDDGAGFRLLQNGFAGLLQLNGTTGALTYSYNASAGIANAGANVSNTAFTILPNGNVGIGIGEPSAKLHIQGSFRLQNGSQGADKVLTSDAGGTATWSGPIGWIGNILGQSAILNSPISFSESSVLYGGTTFEGNNPSSGIIIVPKSGLYQINVHVKPFMEADRTFTAILQTSNVGPWLERAGGSFKKTGLSASNDPANSRHDHVSYSVMIDLIAGQKVRLISYFSGFSALPLLGSNTNPESRSQFSGHLIR